MTDNALHLKNYIRDIPDFPKPGILFRDITPLLADKQAFSNAVKALAEPFADSAIDYVAAVEARGFIFGSAVAEALGAGFIPIRKKGKLPHKTTSVTYDLEYGTDTLEVHTDAVADGKRVLMVDDLLATGVVDDLLATGGTMAAACGLIEKLNAEIVALAFLVELTPLAGRDKLTNHNIYTVISY